jgi:DNA repair exonuclease SbcCD ATPase subunit
MPHNDILSELYEMVTILETELVFSQSSLRSNRLAIAKEKSILESLEMAKSYVIKIGDKTRKEVNNFIEDTVTFAIQTVYGEEYKFVAQFNYDKRDQFEIQWFIDRNGVLLEPRKDTISGGLTDITAFSLRLVIHALEEPDPAPILIMDEPFKNVSKKYIPLVSKMIKEISELLSLQIIMCSHTDELIEQADNIIYL